MNTEWLHAVEAPRRPTSLDGLFPVLAAPASNGPTIPWRRNCLLNFLVLFVFLLLNGGCGRPPQVVDDEECFSAVEALWTAVTTKRTDLLEQSATKLDQLHSAGKLSQEGHDALDEIIRSARASEWMPAAKSLKAFMLGQRKTTK